MTSYAHISSAALKKTLKSLQQKIADPFNNPNVNTEACEQQIQNIHDELEDRGEL